MTTATLTGRELRLERFEAIRTTNRRVDPGAWRSAFDSVIERNVAEAIADGEPAEATAWATVGLYMAPREVGYGL